MAQYFVDLKDLDQKVSLEGAFDPGSIDFSAESSRQVGPLVWSATAERAGEEIRIAGNLKATMETSCSRCLEPAQCDIDKTFDLFFLPRAG